jgi:hypothetical protein
MSQLGGGFRQQRWCEFVLRRGEPMDVFCQYSSLTIRQVRVDDENTLRDLRKTWLEQSPPKSGVRTGAIARALRLVKHIFLVELLFPSVWLMALRVGGGIARSDTPVVLMCSSPPFSLAVAGAVLKSIFGKKVVLVLDMRDLWSMHSAMPGPRIHKRWIERWALARADYITTVSFGLQQRFEEEFGARSDVAYSVATQSWQADSSNAATLDWSQLSPELRKDSTKIVYTGSIPEAFYDLETFISACELFIARSSEPDRLQFVFIGNAQELQTQAQGRLPPGLMVFLPQVSHPDVARMQAAADALIIFGYISGDNQGQASIKIFEYFYRRRPIIALNIAAKSDMDYLISLYCGVCPSFVTAEQVAEVFERVARRDFAGLPIATNERADSDLLAAYDGAVDKMLALAQPPSPQPSAMTPTYGSGAATLP